MSFDLYHLLAGTCSWGVQKMDSSGVQAQATPANAGTLSAEACKSACEASAGCVAIDCPGLSLM